MPVAQLESPAPVCAAQFATLTDALLALSAGMCHAEEKLRDAFVKVNPMPGDTVILTGVGVTGETYHVTALSDGVSVSPPPLSPAQIEREALDAVNMLREEYGDVRLDALPPGKRTNKSQCPVARSLGTLTRRVAVDNERLVIDGMVRPTPPALARFIATFDAGRLPHLAA